MDMKHLPPGEEELSRGSSSSGRQNRPVCLHNCSKNPVQKRSSELRSVVDKLHSREPDGSAAGGEVKGSTSGL